MAPKRRSASAPRRAVGVVHEHGVRLPQDEAFDMVFLALGDTGSVNRKLLSVRDAMARWVAEQNHGQTPAFVLLLGDNFYPSGVNSVRDKQFTETWYNTFIHNQPAFQCPWYAVLGNHDYGSKHPEAQIAYTTSELNRGGHWQMPGRIYAVHHVSSTTPDCSVRLYALDTNPLSLSAEIPNGDRQLAQDLQELQESLAAVPEDESSWRIVFGHHPMYTAGKNHGHQGVLLRTRFRLESLLQEQGVSIYLSGHEHLLQYHRENGLSHVVSGATSTAKAYGGINQKMVEKMTYVDRELNVGFTTVHLNASFARITHWNGDCVPVFTTRIDNPRQGLGTASAATATAAGTDSQTPPPVAAAAAAAAESAAAASVDDDKPGLCEFSLDRSSILSELNGEMEAGDELVHSDEDDALDAACGDLCLRLDSTSQKVRGVTLPSVCSIHVNNRNPAGESPRFGIYGALGLTKVPIRGLNKSCPTGCVSWRHMFVGGLHSVPTLFIFWCSLTCPTQLLH
ncbi:unnamed protein product [Effrenium voratum]|uniref:Calcineurin-like phosphoesterase domain-containing protein n=1 Tax=Effrenium voratum TaxID=2562239 RepID=A0AA36JM65_9DINO|nr:unnamed protein product [Effrenium voratum]CAJ1450016.1 unnamed protein product [Effrenium voratum]